MSQTYDFETLINNFDLADKDDPKADKYFDELIEIEQKKNLIAYSPDMGTRTLTSEITSEENAENTDPISYKKPIASTVKSDKETPIPRKVLNEIKNHQIQIEANTDISATPSKDLSQHLEKLQIDSKKKSKVPVRATQMFDGLVLEKTEPKPHRMTTRLDSVLKTPVLKLRTRSVPKQLEESFSPVASESQMKQPVKEESENKTMMSTMSTFLNNRTIAIKRIGSPLNNAKKFMSLAEQVQHFHKDTPDRFRSKPRNPYNRAQSMLPRQSVIPKTPNLTTKYRSRPTHFLSEKEREDQEVEEMKKHQIKAHPLNEKIFKAPSLNCKNTIEKKPQTIPEPFHLTEVKKKEAQAPSEVFQFKAQPVPSTILKRVVGVPPKKVLLPTTPHTPHIKVPMRLRVEAKSSLSDQSSVCSSDCASPPRNTKVQPFSFDERMKELLKKKEETIKKIIEEEKKIHNSFKANPMPTFKEKLDKLAKHEKSVHRIELQPFNLTQPKPKPVEEEIKQQIRTTPFKATPATAIKKKPFVPILSKPEIPSPNDFHLNTEKRAMERQKYDEMMKKKEEEHAEISKKRQEEEEKLAYQKYLEDRKKAEFKANPVPRYKPFEVHGADPSKLTMPHSPVFTSGKSKMNKVKEEAKQG